MPFEMSSFAFILKSGTAAAYSQRIQFSKVIAPLAKSFGNKSHLIVADEQAESSDKTNFSEYPLPVRRHFQGLGDQFSRDEFISFPTTTSFYKESILNNNVQDAVVHYKVMYNT